MGKVNQARRRKPEIEHSSRSAEKKPEELKVSEVFYTRELMGTGVKFSRYLARSARLDP